MERWGRVGKGKGGWSFFGVSQRNWREGVKLVS